jgi:DNA-binding SARP family transcriptional activator
MTRAEKGSGLPVDALRVGVLGPVTAWLSEREVVPGQPRQRAVLAVLATRANRVVSRGELVDAVWGTHAPATAEGGIYTYVAGLRRILDPGRKRRDPGTVLLSMGAGYMLKLGSGSLDAEAFARGLAGARADRAAGDMAGAERLLSEALALWRGSAFAGVPGPFAEAERRRLAEHRTAAAEEHADVLLALGRNEEAIPELTVLAAEHPLRERTRGLLMVALYRCGRQADALGVYREAREVLAAELGINPGVELTRIHQQVLAMDPGLATPDASGAPVAAASATPPAPVAPGAGEPAPEHPRARVPAQIPIEAAGFSGRLAELDRLHAVVPRHPVANVPIVLITGMAGVGKTALGIRFARQVAVNFPDGQLYVNLRGFDPAAGPTEPGDALPGFLEALGVPGKDVPESLEAQVGLFRSLVDGKRLLVVLDNAHSAAQVRPLLPASPGSMVVITSRRQLTGLVATEGAVPLPLDVLSDSEAHDLLTSRLGRDRIETEPLAARQIIRLCGRLPLALSVIAARAAITQGLTLDALAAELLASGADVLDAGEEAATDVRAAFSWSYAQLSQEAARVFRLLPVHPGPDIALAAAASLAALPAADARRALSELTRASLLAEPARGRFVLHDLLGAYAAELARGTDGEEEIAEGERRLFAHYLRTTDNAVRRMHPGTPRMELGELRPGASAEVFRSYEEARAWVRAELPVLLAAVTHAASRAPALDAYCWQLPMLLASVLVLSGRRHDELACQRIALAAAQRLGDPQALGYAHSGYAYACALFDDTAAAREHLDLALEAFVESGDRASVAQVRGRLALLLEQEGRYAEALEHGREALRLRRAFGNRAAIAHAENAVGWIYAKLGNYVEGLRHCRRALDLATEGGNRPLAADILDSLGLISLGMGDHERALGYYQQALAFFRENGHALLAFSALTGIGDARLAAGDSGAARDAWRQALDTADTVPASVVAQVRDKLRALEKQALPERVATAR